MKKNVRINHTKNVEQIKKRPYRTLLIGTSTSKIKSTLVFPFSTCLSKRSILNRSRYCGAESKIRTAA